MMAKSDVASNPSVVCANEDGEATIFCNRCSEFFCEICAVGHRRHSVRPVAEISPAEVTQQQSSSTSVRCEDHQQPLTIYCTTCNDFVCSTCDSLTHLAWSHDRQDVKAAAQIANEQLGHISKVITRYMANQDSVLEQMKKLEENVSKDVTKALEDVEKRAERLCRIINDRKEQLTKQLELCQSIALTTAKSIRKEATNNKTDAQTLKDDAENLSKHGSDIDQIKTTPRKRKDLRELMDRKQQRMTWKFEFESEDVSEETIRKTVGDVHFTSSSECPRETATPRITLGKHIHSVPLVYDGDYSASGIAVVGECLCITHYSQPDLWLYDMAQGGHKVCRVPDLEGARGMHLLTQDGHTLVITDASEGGGKLHFVKVEPEKLEIADHEVKDIPLTKPAAISVSEESGHLLIGQENKMEFLVCNTEGDVLEQVQVPDTDGGGVQAWCVTATRDGYAVLVGDKDWKGRIQWLDEDGRYTHTYGRNDGERMQYLRQILNVPGTEGSLIAVDHGNFRLHLVDSNRCFSQYLLTKEDEIPKPDCAYLDEAASKLYVAFCNSPKEVRVYKWSSLGTDIEIKTFQAAVRLGQLLTFAKNPGLGFLPEEELGS